jgi:drug/metabolite transporter (DMT)-like permease
VVAVAAAQLCYFNAVPRLGVGVSLLLEYSGTVLVVLWTWLVHGQRPGRLTLAGSALAALGLALVLDVVGSVHLDPVGVLYGLGAAVGLAGYYILSAAVPADPERPGLPAVVVAWAGTGVGALVLGAAALAGVLPFTTSSAPVTLMGLRTPWPVPVLGLALVAAALAYVIGIAGARLLGARLSTFVGLTEVLFAVLFAWVLLGQLPSAIQLAGGLVVLAGVVLVHAGERPTGDVTERDESNTSFADAAPVVAGATR